MADIAPPASALRLTVAKAPSDVAAPQVPFAPQQSFVKRQLVIAIRLTQNPKTNQPTQFDNGTDTVTLVNHRARVRIRNAGTPAGSDATIEVFGLPLSLINQISSLGMSFQLVTNNTVTVQAGNAGVVPTTVFTGTIQYAYGDFSGAPDVPLTIVAQSGLAYGVAPVPATSFPGAADVPTIMQKFAAALGLPFENSGVSAQIANPYLPGTLREQIQRLAQAVRINAEIVDGGTKFAIWPVGSARNAQAEIPLISKTTGMIGYPAYTQQGILVRTIFDPRITYGSKFRVETSVKLLTNTWAVNQLDLGLDAELPGGEWQTTINAYNPEQGRPIVQPTR